MPFAGPPRRILSMSIPYDVLTLTVAGIMVGNEFAVAAFVHPQLRRMSQKAHAEAAQLLASSLGRWMPFWYALTLGLMIGAAFEHRPVSGTPDVLIAVAALLWFVAILFTVTKLVPINNRITRMDPDRPHDIWLCDRCQWDKFHRMRVLILAIAFVLLLTGVLQSIALPTH
jgi:hypothetical protein